MDGWVDEYGEWVNSYDQREVDGYEMRSVINVWINKHCESYNQRLSKSEWMNTMMIINMNNDWTIKMVESESRSEQYDQRVNQRNERESVKIHLEWYTKKLTRYLINEWMWR